MGILRILDIRLGDKQILYNKENSEDAKREFDEATHKGYLAFEINSSGARQLVKELNKDADEIILIPPMVGG